MTEKRFKQMTGFSVVYALVFSATGLYFAYYSVFLKSKGVPVSEIGILISVYFGASAACQPFLGVVYDRSRRKHMIISACAFISAAAAAMIPSQNSLLGRAGFTLLFSVFAGAVPPLMDAGTLVWCAQHGVRFQAIRTWGSVGYLAGCGLGGVILGRLGLIWSYYGFTLCMSLAGVLVLFLSRAGWMPLGRSEFVPASTAPVTWGAIKEAVSGETFLALLVLAFLYRIPLTGPMAFLSTFVVWRGLGAEHVGIAYALTALSEIAVLFAGQRGKVKASPNTLLTLSVLAAAVRWYLTPRIVSVPLMLAVQLLHGVTFMLFLVVSVQVVNKCVRPELSGVGQTVFGSVFYGFGPVTGTAIAGPMLERFGYARYFSMCGAMCAVIGLAYLGYAVSRSKSERKPGGPP